MTTMQLSYRQEAFSLAYVRAVAATAGFRVQDGTQPDDDSVDLTIAARGPGGTTRSPKIDVQLKCKLGAPAGEPTWPYDLSLKNYEDLRHTDFQVPRVLVVVAVQVPRTQRFDVAGLTAIMVRLGEGGLP
jgi:hypothetical protein